MRTSEKREPPAPAKQREAAKANLPLRIAELSNSANPAAAIEINQLHQQIVAATRVTLQSAIRIGELLTQTRAALPHGHWLAWLEANIGFAERTARNYIRVYREQDRIKSANVADLTDAYGLLSEPAVEQQLKAIERRLIQQRAEAIPLLEAIEKIRDQKLYRKNSRRFEDYTRDRWGLKPGIIEALSEFCAPVRQRGEAEK
jgi:hypothetical protein